MRPKLREAKQALSSPERKGQRVCQMKSGRVCPFTPVLVLDLGHQDHLSNGDGVSSEHPSLILSYTPNDSKMSQHSLLVMGAHGSPLRVCSDVVTRDRYAKDVLCVEILFCTPRG